MDQFAAMRAFVKVVETGGFSEAARQLELAVSSVTRQVNSLETMLNTQLLNRSTRSITLTPQGRNYYNRAVRILQDVEEANLCVMEREDTPRGLLKVGMPVAFGRLHIAPIISTFLTQYAEVKLDLRLSDGLSNLVEEELDIVIRIGNLDRSHPNLIVRKLASHSRVVCASPNYFQQHGKPQHPNDLAHHNCLLFAYTDYNIWRFERDTEVCEVKVSGTLVANNSEILRQVCLDGAGLILMPTWLIGEDIRARRLQAVLTDFQVSPHTETDMGIYALYLPNRRYSLRVKTFIDFLIQQFGNPPYWEA
ncbi:MULTISPECIES: LysR family transcriptional regulator [Fischerella]|uniref:LysR family transcriptional regulator n=1 Tax=Fischerella muscicola CCMEE 5323 TaxID=2019572 RepID=A0A2N6K342_FISMU|nr:MULTISPECIES: LysR family transcriptional regulator [Fischerella]MBD2435096.1 LysR family transcriptional regulator [Fischerella sp. FACHB-380]PLZ89816.1 LysR family transcriptional regulator [Fischerella muscicola CCMEE 5323]